MKVAVAVHGRFHAFDLVRELASRQIMVSLATTYPRAVARRFLPPEVKVHAAPLLEIVRRVAPYLRGCPSPDVWIASRFGRFVARSLPDEADIFVGWSGASLEALHVARSRGMRIVIERGSTHIGHQARILAEEYGRHGSDRPAVDARMVERELAEYGAADAIMVPTRYAAKTFIREGINPQKLAVNPYGVDLARFVSMPVMRPLTGTVGVLFVGRVGIRKGVPYLLQAMSAAGSDFELHLVGPIEADVKGMLKSFESDRLHVHGPLRGAALESQFQNADIFCLPSLEEGLSLALLQAMAAGLPVIATPETGVEDVMATSHEAMVVPARDPDKIAEALSGLRRQDTRIAMGTAARSRVASGFNWANYGERALAFYKKLLTDSPLSNNRSHDE